MLIYGAGGHAKVVLDCIRGMGKDVSVFFDDSNELTELKGIPVVSPYSPDVKYREELVIAVGDNLLRKQIAEKVKHRFGEAIHSSARLSHYSFLDEGTVVMPNVIVNADAVVGKHCILNSASVVEHDCIVEDFVHIAPTAVLGGGVKVGEGTLIGIGAMLLPFVTVGKWCIVGAGAVVTADVPDFSVVAGVPAYPINRTGAQV